MLSFLKVIFCFSLLCFSSFLEAPVLAFDFFGSEFFVFNYSVQFILVFALSILFRNNYAFFAIILYLIAGLAGLEVFSFGSGVSYTLSPHFGYLLAMLLLSALAFQLKYYFDSSVENGEEVVVNKFLLPLIPFFAAHIFGLFYMIVLGNFNLENLFALGLYQIFYDLIFGALAFFMMPRV